MKSALATARMGIRVLLSSPGGVIMLTLFPIVLIFVLGNALSSLMTNDDEISPAPAVYLSETAGTPLYRFLSEDPEVSRFVELVDMDYDAALEALETGEICAVVIEDGEDVRVLQTADQPRGSGLVRSVVEGYRQMGAAAAKAIHPQYLPALAETEIAVTETALGTRVPKAIDYYAVTMLVMITLYTGLNAMELFKKNLLGNFGQRLQVTPASRASVVTGTLAGSAVTSFLQLMVTFVVSGVVFGVYWGERVPLVLLTLFVLVLFSMSLCIFLMLLTGSEGAAAGLSQVAFWGLTFISDGFMVIDWSPAVENVFQYAPNAMAHTVIFGAIYGGREEHMMLCLGLLAAVTAVLFGLSFILGRRRLA